MASVAASSSLVSGLHALDGNFTARERIVALARACASALESPAPRAFSDDPESPAELVAALAEVPTDELNVDALGTTWEELLSTHDKRSQGAHFTPMAVADRVARIAFELVSSTAPHTLAPDTPRIWDPACGGGAFLLAAARWLDLHTSHTRAAIVASLHASDVDSDALDVCDAALEIWCSGGARPITVAADALLDLPEDWPDEFAVVIGNPPFLGQLTTDTSRTSERRERLSAQYASAAGAYVDEAGLFVELATARTARGGVVGLILPESILGARDAKSMRTMVSSAAHLSRLWIDEGQSFAAAVDVVAVFLSVGSGDQPSTDIAVGLADPVVLTAVPTPPASSWAPLLARALGVPTVAISNTIRVGERAAVTAGFRQHFYGIADAVSEAADTPTDAPDADTRPKLVTSGAIEPLRSLWGQRPVRFAGTKWNAPVLVLDNISDDQVRSWFRARCVPKLLLASQTKIVEVLADPRGELVPSVPVISVEPHDASELWHLAAVLTAPAISAWMLQEAAGTGLSHDAIRLRAATLALVPVPPTTPDAHRAWDEGAAAAKRAHEAAGADDPEMYTLAMKDLAAAMNAAYGVGEHVASWWWERIRLPLGSDTTQAPRIR